MGVLLLKKLCIATHVYGEKYQGFIPMYIYSILKSYPQYSVYIYVDKFLLPDIKQQLVLLENMGDFKVFENCNVKSGLINKAYNFSHIPMSLRWLEYDSSFEEFEAVYLGDIDIFICKEEPGLYEQHMRHCEYLNLPYSNCIRNKESKKVKSIKYLAAFITTCGIRETYKYLISDQKGNKRFSGLHFIQTKEYYTKVLPLIPKYIEELNLVVSKRSKKWNLCMFDINEIILYELIKESGLKLPPVAKDGVDSVGSNYNSISFRPHHGIHLGLFRGDALERYDHKTLTSETYRNYYCFLQKLRDNDETMKKIEDGFTPFVKSLFTKMDDYYSKYN